MKQKGFTLVENVIALAILAIMATMFAGIFTSAVRTSVLANNRDADRERALASIELAAAGQGTDALESEPGAVTIDFGGKKISAGGKFLTGVYGEEKLELRFFLTEGSQ